MNSRIWLTSLRVSVGKYFWANSLKSIIFQLTFKVVFKLRPPWLAREPAVQTSSAGGNAGFVYPTSRHAGACYCVLWRTSIFNRCMHCEGRCWFWQLRELPVSWISGRAIDGFKPFSWDSRWPTKNLFPKRFVWVKQTSKWWHETS
jgi:hypothetical protein